MTSRIFHLLRLHLGLSLAAFALAGATARAGAVAAAPDVTATVGFDPAQIGAGDITHYNVAISGFSSAPSFDPPKVDGLDLVGRGSSYSIRFANGEMSTDVSLQFSIRASKPGHYTIPAYNVTVNGKTVAVPAATLDVTDQPASSAAPAGGNASVAASGNKISLVAKPPRTDLYVGEKLPLDITLTWQPELQPQLSGEFTQDNESFQRVDLVGKPSQSEVNRNGQRYGTASWHSSLTPIKAGAQTLSFTLPLQINTPGQSDDPMTRILMGSMPNMFGQQQSINLVSTPLDLNVQPLPDDGRPANFTGGIGNFSVTPPSLESTDLQVGVPVTFKLTVSGQGNFDRFQAPTLDLGTLWRSYPPKETFTAQDAIGYNGEKTFEYVIMPMSDNITALPSAEFNYFNPDTKTYVDQPTAPIPVTVKPAPPGQAPAPLPAVASAPTEPGKPELVGLHVDAGGWQSPQLHPILTAPDFWAAQAVAAGLFATLVITRRRQLRLENDPVYARRRRARQQANAALASARAAAAQGRAAEFYTLSQRALQEAATPDRLDAAEALTWQEFDAHLAKHNTPPEFRQQAREIFDAGDALRFGGFTPDQADLTAASTRLDGLVKQLLERT
jgi:hypothetical protein